MHKFDFEAMNTELNLLIGGADENMARGAAYDCFQDVSQMENLLSMYRYGSDISMLNNAEVGETIKLSGTATDCLLVAFQANAASRGAIDVCMGEFFLKAKNDKQIKAPENPRRGKFAFDPENLLIQKLEAGRIDLGAIGKGFAVDMMIKKLADIWEIENAFVSFGGSSTAAIGRNDNGEEWTVTLGGGTNMQIALEGRACGASGTAVLGRHIIDARSGEVPQTQPFRTWAFTDSAAMADAMSTAFMILSRDEIGEICREQNIGAAIQESEKSEIELINF